MAFQEVYHPRRAGSYSPLMADGSNPEAESDGASSGNAVAVPDGQERHSGLWHGCDCHAPIGKASAYESG